MQTRWSRRRLIRWLGTGWILPGVVACRTPQPRGTSTPAPRIIDTHTHFYDPTRPQGVPWPPANDPVLHRTVLPPDYRALATPAPVAGTVVVEASPWVEDNQWILDLAARDRFIVGFVGNLPLGTEAFAGHWRRFTANPLFRGLRIRDVDLERALQQPAFIADLRRIAASGLSLDLVGGPDLLGPALRIARALPELQIVIDHLAGVRIDGGPPPAAWLEGMSRLAECANVAGKLSGLVEGSGRRGLAPVDVEFYRPVLDAMWSRFGPDRLIYASNWPVCEHYATLFTVQKIVADYCQGRGPEAEDKVFRKNSWTVYRWIERP